MFYLTPTCLGPRLGDLVFEGWGEPTRTLVPWRQGFRHSTRNECMGWFAQIEFELGLHQFITAINYIVNFHMKTNVWLCDLF